MKKRVSKIALILCMVLVLVMSIALTACDKDTNTETAKKIYISSKGQALKVGTTVALTVITDPEGEAWDIDISDPSLVGYDENNGCLYVVATRVLETSTVTVTVSLVKDPTVKASKTFTVIASERTEASYVVVTADKYTIAAGDPALLTISTSNDEAYDVTLSNKSYAAYNNGVLTVFEAPDEDTQITVTVSLKSDPTVKSSKTFTIKAKEEAPTLKLKSDVGEIAVVNDGETKNKAQLTVSVIPDAEYTLSASSDKIAINDDNTVEIVGDVPYDTRVTITAKLKDHPEVKSSVSLYLRALQKEGQVDGANGLKLTTEMMKTVSNASITAKGTLVDYYVVYGGDTKVTSYDTVVYMEEGRWSGSWNITGKKNGTVITDIYKKGTEKVNYAYDRDTGVFYSDYEMLKLYINKDNQVAEKRVTSYDSTPIAWTQQHLYNPMSHFALNVSKKFRHVDIAAENFDIEAYGYNSTEYAVFKYVIDSNDADDWYYATYLSYAFTPMGEDTIDNIYIVVGKDGIVGFIGETEHTSYGATDDEGYPIEGETATSESYTVLNIKFSDIGKTTVADPTPYTTTASDSLTQGAYTALLTMIKTMNGATNYTFEAVDATTYSPSIDESEYQVSGSTDSSASSTSTSSSTSSKKTVTNPYASTRTQDGTVGTVGYITADAIVLGTTGKYEYGMSGDPLYYTDYTGYKQVSESYYDEFAFDSSADAFVGKKRYAGTVKDMIPQFEFAAEIFKFKSVQTVESDRGANVYVYEYTLRDVTIAKDVAMELSMYKYAEDAVSDVGSDFSIWVDQYGNLIKSVYQYSIVSGTYTGYVTTTYSAYGSTKIADKAFDGYVQRTPETSWASFTDLSYFHKHTTLCSAYNCSTSEPYDHSGHHATVDKIIEDVFGDSYASVPTPDVFTGIFGDNLHAPGFNWKTVEGATGDIYKDYIEFTLSYDVCDENKQIIQSDYQRLMTALGTALNAKGYTKSDANSNTDKDPLQGGSRYATFINSDAGIQIVVENNFTRYFWVYIYHAGDWSLK